MPNPISNRRYAFSDAAFASGVASPKAMRNWIDKSQVPGLEADAERSGGGWRRFSVFDILKLALVKRMVDFGVSVEFAALAASGWLVSAMPLLTYRNTPPAALAAHFRGAIGLIWRNPPGWDGRMLMPGLDAHAPAKDAWLTVDIGAVAEAVVAALADLEEAAGDGALVP